MNKSNIVKTLFEKIDFNSLNHEIINHNSLLLYKYFLELQKIYNSLPKSFEHIKLKELEGQEKQFLKRSFLINNPEIKKFIKDVKNVIKIVFENVEFYYLCKNDETYKYDIIVVLFNKQSFNTLEASLIF
jgi:hypothetical protein